MDTSRPGARSRRMPIAWKFFLLLAVVVPSVASVSLVGGRGMGDMKARLDQLFDDSFTRTHVIGQLAVQLQEAEEVSLRLIDEANPAQAARLRSALQAEIIPEVDRGLNELLATSATGEDRTDHVRDERLQTQWQRFLAYTNSPEFLAASGATTGNDGPVEETIVRLGDSLRSIVERDDAQELRQVEAARLAAGETYTQSVALLRLILVLGLLAGVGATALLTRAVVGRVREYSNVAKRVAAGELQTRARPRGHDELTDLGWALNEMVARGESVRGYEASQGEFTEAMQVTQGEEEAHGLLKRHIERSIPGSAVVVLNRNNSADRLEATTELPPDTDLTEKLPTAQPRDCMAVRLARTHQEGAGTEPLISCGLCRGLAAYKTCNPLLVGGEVIGSVLVNHETPLEDDQLTRVRDSVSQAAPVLANLRNLAIAELRAATDSLSGLPNARAVQDTLKRLVAQAARMVWPLTAVLLDLDHFKKINDTFGHGRGDEVLAAVGVALQSTLRASDFVGRYGGEEFIMLLPDTGQEGAMVIAERVRAAIEAIGVNERDRVVTASFGLAVFPDHAPDAARLIRSADRALYRAKANGRNRVEVFTPAASPDGDGEASESPEPEERGISLVADHPRA